MTKRGPGRPKVKDSASLNLKCEQSIIEKLNHYCETVGQTKTKAVESMLSICLDQWAQVDESENRLLTRESFKREQPPKEGTDDE